MKLLTADTKGKDIIVVNKDRQIAEAKKHALLFLKPEYTIHRTDVKCTWKKKH
jgi:3-hydroxyacyl-CoA dehydrogenase